MYNTRRSLPGELQRALTPVIVARNQLVSGSCDAQLQGENEGMSSFWLDVTLRRDVWMRGDNRLHGGGRGEDVDTDSHYIRSGERWRCVTPDFRCWDIHDIRLVSSTLRRGSGDIAREMTRAWAREGALEIWGPKCHEYKSTSMTDPEAGRSIQIEDSLRGDKRPWQGSKCPKDADNVTDRIDWIVKYLDHARRSSCVSSLLRARVDRILIRAGLRNDSNAEGRTLPVAAKEAGSSFLD
ncbi:hypothetical protein Tco_0409005 [Tanacetum coccineum]